LFWALVERNPESERRPNDNANLAPDFSIKVIGAASLAASDFIL
jgi:hypothetical protein